MTQEEESELLHRIALTMVPAIGPVTARKLIEHMGSARRIFKERDRLQNLQGIGPRMMKAFTCPGLLLQAEKEMEFIQKHHISALYYGDPDYPARLKECSDGPILLYARGKQGLNPARSLSVVGTRSASAYGRDLCRAIVLELCSRLEDLAIVSGLAYGIDVMAHRAALEGGVPTVAVLGHGLGTIYPRIHRDTARQITGQGALVTDFHSSLGPERNNFLRRNRIIAGMADATLVVESGAAGGGMITASLSASYGREVLAVPGRTIDSRSRGCNRLIKEHTAALVESAEDVLQHLNWDLGLRQAVQLAFPVLPLRREEQKLLELIRQRHPVGPGELSIHSGLPIHEVLSLLTEMELKKLVAVEPGNLYQPRISVHPS